MWWSNDGYAALAGSRRMEAGGGKQPSQEVHTYTGNTELRPDRHFAKRHTMPNLPRSRRRDVRIAEWGCQLNPVCVHSICNNKYVHIHTRNPQIASNVPLGVQTAALLEDRGRSQWSACRPPEHVGRAVGRCSSVVLRRHCGRADVRTCERSSSPLCGST